MQSIGSNSEYLAVDFFHALCWWYRCAVQGDCRQQAAVSLLPGPEVHVTHCCYNKAVMLKKSEYSTVQWGSLAVGQQMLNATDDLHRSQSLSCLCAGGEGVATCCSVDAQSDLMPVCMCVACTQCAKMCTVSGCGESTSAQLHLGCGPSSHGSFAGVQ